MHQPQRIASLLSSATEILFATGAGPRVVAVSHECDFPDVVKSLPIATRSRIDSGLSSAAIDEQVRGMLATGAPLYEVDREQLRQLAPDLIVTQAQCDVCAVRHADVIDLVQSEPVLANTHIITLNPQSLGDVIADTATLGAAAGCSQQAATFAEELQSRVDAVRQRTALIADARRPRVLCIEWIEPLMPAGNWTPELIELAGGVSGLAVAGRHSRYAEWDEVLALDPEVILIAPCGFDLVRALQEARELPQRDGWRRLAAVRAGRVFAFDGNAYLNRSGPRLVDTLEMVAQLLHPDIFAAPPLAENAQPPWRRLDEQ